MNVIECNRVSKVYRQTRALDEISFSITANKITGIIGRNGAGKTTILKILAGLIKETSGEVKVFSESPFNNLFVSANLIFINDQMNFPSSLSLAEILKEAERFYDRWDRGLADGLFSYFSFNRKQTYNNLSKGMKSTFNMILGLAARCAITIFDEPTTGMDAAVRKDFYRALLKDYMSYPRTILLSSHHLDEIEDLLEDVLLIKDGKKHLHLPISELKEWAIGLAGSSHLVNEWIEDKTVYFNKGIGMDQLYAVVKNDFSESAINQARLLGLRISAVSPNDLCIYMTNKSAGGIDDVFSQA